MGTVIIPPAIAGQPSLTIECETDGVSDSYHTFGELYEHRLFLYMAFMKLNGGWKSRKHHDGDSWDGWFIAGTTVCDKQISYHLPDRLWDMCPVPEVDKAPEWDGHTSQDVIDRLGAFLFVG